jgi:hypothetical protein
MIAEIGYNKDGDVKVYEANEPPGNALRKPGRSALLN